MTSPTALILHRANEGPPAAAFSARSLGGDDPFGSVREIAWEGAKGMAVGRYDLAGRFDVSSFPHVEIIVVVAGELRLQPADSAQLTITANQAVVVGRGTKLSLEAAAGTRVTFCSADSESTDLAGVTELIVNAPFKPSLPPPPEVLLGPTPSCRSHNAFTDNSARVLSGTWDSTPYRRIVRAHGKNELMHIVAGRVAFAAPDGSVLEAGIGDTVFIPQGAPCAWESRERVAKFYVVQDASS